MKKTGAKSKADPKAQSGRRTIVIALAAILVLSASLASWFFLRSADTPQVAAVERPAKAEDDKIAAMRNGVVIFQRRDGTNCGRKVFDNTTGKLHGLAGIDCLNETASISQHSKPRYNPGTRLEAVRSAFQPATGSE